MTTPDPIEPPPPAAAPPVPDAPPAPDAPARGRLRRADRIRPGPTGAYRTRGPHDASPRRPAPRRPAW